MNKMIVLQGVPASGKSTWARNFVKEHKDYVIVSRDAIRESRGEYWIPEQEQYITDCEDFQIRAAIKRKLNVIIDATNLNETTIKKWEDLATELNCDIEFKLFKIGYKEALERDKNRERPVGEKVLKQFFRRYFPNEALNLVDVRPILEPNHQLPKCIICNIDGTVSLRNGRNPFNYSKVHEDSVDPRMQQLLNIIGTNFKEEITIFFLSGREGTEECSIKTLQWLGNNFDFDHRLIMRRQGDFRKDSIIKKELYEQHIKDNYDVVAVFDNRNQVVDMWRELGLLCCQVYYGDF